MERVSESVLKTLDGNEVDVEKRFPATIQESLV